MATHETAEPKKFLVKHFKRKIGYMTLAYFAMCAMFWFVFPLTPGRTNKVSAELVDHLFIWQYLSFFAGSFNEKNILIAILILAATFFSFAIYGTAIFYSLRNHTDNNNLKLVVSSSIFLYFISVFALPNMNTDIYNYITRARVAVVYGENPHYVSADEFPEDPLYKYANHRYTRLVGDKFAMWTWISIPVAWFGGNSPFGNLLAFRLLFFITNCANILLIVAILKKIKPGAVLTGVLLYAWHPTVVILGQSKTDTVMVFFLLLGIWSLMNRQNFFAAAALTMSVLTKIISLPLLGLFLARDLKGDHWKKLLGETTVIIAIIFILHYPLWEGPALINGHLKVILGEAGFSLPPYLRIFAFFAAIVFFIGIGIWQNGNTERLFVSWTIIMACMSLFVLRISYAWYHIVFIMTFSLLASRWAIVLGIFYTALTFFFTNWYLIFGKHFPPPPIFNLPMPVKSAAIFILLTLFIWFLKRLQFKGKLL